MIESKSDYPEYSFATFKEGSQAKQDFTISHLDLDKFISLSGDSHPLHSISKFAIAKGFQDVIIHGAFIQSKCSKFIAENFVGKNGILLSVSSDFLLPAYCDDLLTWFANVSATNFKSKTLEITWRVMRNKAIIYRGKACIWIER